MKSQNTTQSLCLLLAVTLTGALGGLVWGAAFTATIPITGGTTLCAGESTTLTTA